MRKVDSLNLEKTALIQPPQNAVTMLAQEKKMALCEICGSFLVAKDAVERTQSHITGKQHIGYGMVRDFLSEYKVAKERAMEEERLARENEAEERRKLREKKYKSRSRSRRSDSSDRDRYRDRDWEHSRDRERSRGWNGKGCRDEGRGMNKRRHGDYRNGKERDRIRSRSPVRHCCQR